jgi:arylsulfatase A-like enzyme
VHTPLQAAKADFDALPKIEPHRMRVYAAMIRNLDRNVGRLLQALKEDALDRNTIVVFTSDNGGANYIGLPDINRPYRGWKATFFEGGLHVPYFMRWPAKIPAGSKYDGPVGHVDIFATAAAAAGAAVPTDRKIDGVDLLPFITGQQTAWPHKTLFWRSGGDLVLLSDGWKLQHATRPDKSFLYNLTLDPTEHHNLADSEPAKLHALSTLLDAENREQAKPLWPSLFSVAVPIDRPLGVPGTPDEEYVYWDN